MIGSRKPNRSPLHFRLADAPSPQQEAQMWTRTATGETHTSHARHHYVGSRPWPSGRSEHSVGTTKPRADSGGCFIARSTPDPKGAGRYDQREWRRVSRLRRMIVNNPLLVPYIAACVTIILVLTILQCAQ